MGFNFGAFGSGLSEGIGQGVSIQDQQLSRQLKQQQLQEYLNNQAAQRAMTNVAMPGASAMPGTPGNPGSGTPLLAQMPFLGPIVRGFQGAGDMFKNFLPSTGPEDTAMPPPPQAPQGPPPQAAPTQAAPSPAPAAQSAPTDQGGAPIPGMQVYSVVAQAIDRANPGLRTSNPQAFSAAVQLGVNHIKDYATNQAAISKQNAETTHLGAQTEAEKSKVPLNEAHAHMYEERSKYGPYGKTPVDQLNKQIQAELTNNATMLRHYETEKARLLQAPVQTPEIKALVVETNGRIKAHADRDKILRAQLPTADIGKTPAPPGGTSTVDTPSVTAAKQAELNPIINTMVGLGGDPVKTTQYTKKLMAAGVPKNEIEHILKTAQARLAVRNDRLPQGGAQAAPQIPMSQ